MKTIKLILTLTLTLLCLTACNRIDECATPVQVTKVGSCIGEDQFDAACSVSYQSYDKSQSGYGTIRDLVMEGQTLYKTCWSKEDGSRWCEANLSKRTRVEVCR